MNDKTIVFIFAVLGFIFLVSRAFIAFVANEIPSRFALLINEPSFPTSRGFRRVPRRWAKLYGWIYTICALGLAINVLWAYFFAKW